MHHNDLVDCIYRNFGGLKVPLSQSSFKIFFEQAHSSELDQRLCSLPTSMDLITGNLRDCSCRHLMLITQGDSVVNLVGDFFERAGVTSYRVMVGSKLKGDLNSEGARYRALSEIILSMERGESLALQNLDSIYNSLYDMLNQNYTVVAGKKNCRVALGAFSNPMAHVHDNFKCIVIVDEANFSTMDPPFLNRFEKQILNFESLLSQVNHKPSKVIFT